MRPPRLRRSGISCVTAGCFVCNGCDAIWEGRNAHGVAARHHDATGHPTWVDAVLTVRYGSKESEDEALGRAALGAGAEDAGEQGP